MVLCVSLYVGNKRRESEEVTSDKSYLIRVKAVILWSIDIMEVRRLYVRNKFVVICPVELLMHFGEEKINYFSQKIIYTNQYLN